MPVRPKAQGCSVKARLGPIRIHFNPIVSFFSIFIIWGFVVWAVIEQENAKVVMSRWKYQITKSFTWFYLGTYNIMFVFILGVYFSKYGNIKLGKKDEKPEFCDSAYFSMLFAAGIGAGLFYFSVAEPVMHYADPNNRYHTLRTDNQKAQDALNITIFHWGLHCWGSFVLVGLTLAVIGYRFGMPITMRSSMYPLLGSKIFGRLGDIIDVISVFCTMFSVCASLGFGVMQLNAGFHRLFPAIPQKVSVQVAMIWIITCISTISVVSGTKVGIRRLSEICIAIGCLLMLVIFFGTDSSFLLNLIVQTIGHYFNTFIATGTHTDAFAQLNNSLTSSTSPHWMNNWTIFYYAWWSAACPSVGMFIAKISRGRTVRCFIFYTLTVPFAYMVIWFCVLGGSGILMEREAAKLGLGNGCNEVGLANFTGNISAGRLKRLSCRAKEDMLFDVMNSFEGIGTFMCWFTITTIVLYFVTCSDSGSLVIDCLTSNGEADPPVLQRIFWSATEGMCATALLLAGGGKTDALETLQSGAICTGLFFTVVLNFMILSCWRALRILTNDTDDVMNYFLTDIVDPLYTLPKAEAAKEHLAAIVGPWHCLSYAAKSTSDEPGRRWPAIVLTAVPFYLWVALLVASAWTPDMMYLAWSFYVGFAIFAAGIRSTFRERHKINGNPIEDCLTMLFAYPLAVVQLKEQMKFIEESGGIEDSKEIEHEMMDIQRAGTFCDSNLVSHDDLHVCLKKNIATCTTMVDSEEPSFTCSD